MRLKWDNLGKGLEAIGDAVTERKLKDRLAGLDTQAKKGLQSLNVHSPGQIAAYNNYTQNIADQDYKTFGGDPQEYSAQPYKSGGYTPNGAPSIAPFVPGKYEPLATPTFSINDHLGPQDQRSVKEPFSHERIFNEVGAAWDSATERARMDAENKLGGNTPGVVNPDGSVTMPELVVSAPSPKAALRYLSTNMYDTRVEPAGYTPQQIQEAQNKLIIARGLHDKASGEHRARFDETEAGRLAAYTGTSLEAERKRYAAFEDKDNAERAAWDTRETAKAADSKKAVAGAKAEFSVDKYFYGDPATKKTYSYMGKEYGDQKPSDAMMEGQMLREQASAYTQAGNMDMARALRNDALGIERNASADLRAEKTLGMARETLDLQLRNGELTAKEHNLKIVGLEREVASAARLDKFYGVVTDWRNDPKNQGKNATLEDLEKLGQQTGLTPADQLKAYAHITGVNAAKLELTATTVRDIVTKNPSLDGLLKIYKDHKDFDPNTYFVKVPGEKGSFTLQLRGPDGAVIETTKPFTSNEDGYQYLVERALRPDTLHKWMTDQGKASDASLLVKSQIKLNEDHGRAYSALANKNAASALTPLTQSERSAVIQGAGNMIAGWQNQDPSRQGKQLEPSNKGDYAITPDLQRQLGVLTDKFHQQGVTPTAESLATLLHYGKQVQTIDGKPHWGYVVGKEFVSFGVKQDGPAGAPPQSSPPTNPGQGPGPGRGLAPDGPATTETRIANIQARIDTAVARLPGASGFAAKNLEDEITELHRKLKAEQAKLTK